MERLKARDLIVNDKSLCIFARLLRWNLRRAAAKYIGKFRAHHYSKRHKLMTFTIKTKRRDKASRKFELLYLITNRTAPPSKRHCPFEHRSAEGDFPGAPIFIYPKAALQYRCEDTFRNQITLNCKVLMEDQRLILRTGEIASNL